LRPQLLTFVIFSLLLMPISLKANELSKVDEQTITWHTFSAPPLMITTGTGKGTGIIDGARKLIQGEITDRLHDELELPYKRFLLYAKEGMNVCTPYLFKTPEREKFLMFSKPAVIFPGYEIILHADTYAKLDYPESISLEALFKKHQFRLATNKIRAYGLILDPIIKKYDRKKLISRHPGSTTLVFRLLTKGRADFMLDFPNRILYWAHELGIDADDYISIPITEDYKNAVSYVACPKTPWGENVIKRVNVALDKHIPTQKYLSILQRWSPAYHQQEIEELHQELVKMK